MSRHIQKSSIIKGTHYEIIESSIDLAVLEPDWDAKDIKDYLVYEAFIKTYITKGLIKEALPLVKRSIELNEQYDVITVLILVYHFMPELNEESKILTIKIISYLYKQPLQLVEIIDKLLNTSLTCL